MQIKLTKVEDAPYMCSATYEWEGHIIERDGSCLAGGNKYWYCDTLFKGHAFRTLKGIRKAIQLKVEGKLTERELMWCEEE